MKLHTGSVTLLGFTARTVAQYRRAGSTFFVMTRLVPLKRYGVSVGGLFIGVQRRVGPDVLADDLENVA